MQRREFLKLLGVSVAVAAIGLPMVVSDAPPEVRWVKRTLMPHYGGAYQYTGMFEWRGEEYVYAELWDKADVPDFLRRFRVIMDRTVRYHMYGDLT